MLQRFDDPDAADGATRLRGLRAALAAAGLDGFVVPRADAHQGEVVAPCDARLAWLTGFTGSAGLCVALASRAALFVDGRYGLQAKAQVDGAAFEIVSTLARSAEDWLAEAAPRGAVIGLDPMLHTTAGVASLRTAVERVGGTLRLLDANPLDDVWTDRPAPPTGAMRAQPLALAGEDSAAKRARVGATVAAAGAAVAVLTLPDSIAWLMNLRGADVARTPAPHAFALLAADGTATLFAHSDKIDAAVREHLGNAIALAPPEAFGPALDALAGRAALVDRDSAPAWVGLRLEAAGATVAWGRDPCILPKAIKNAAERDGARAAHRRDGVAMARFLRWLADAAPAGGLSEIDVVRALEGFRARDPLLRDLSFDTICGAGEHGAIIHYRVTTRTNRAVRPGEPLLVDSGGQYPDGTTDVTRTLAVGAVEPEARQLFTLVLKGMIAVSRARFPAGTTGRELDPLARVALWRAGHDYAHGTGHGVGSHLSVHEGPQGLSRRATEPLQAGMIVSDEPGCYLEGRFGVRIENLLLVTPAETVAGGAQAMLGFETLTLAPIDRAMIAPALLDAAERDWLDAYHARVLAEIGPLVEPDVRDWLAAACAPL